jgi:SAM-dependent methyltransferase
VPARHIRTAGAPDMDGDFGALAIAQCDSCGHMANAAFRSESAEHLYEVHPSTNAPVHESMLRGLESIAANILGTPIGPQRILEIGCGVGALARLLARDAACVHLIEPNLSAADAKFGNDRISFLPGFFPAATTGERYDLVVCRQVLEHVETPLAFLKAIREHVAPGGRAYVEVPSADYIARHASVSDFHYLHVQYFTDAVLRGMFARAGFEVTRFDSIKDGHDYGYHLIPAASREVPWPGHVNVPDDLPLRLAARLATGRVRLAALDGPVAFYGACAYAQAAMGVYADLCKTPLILDDTDAYEGHEAYSRLGRFAVRKPTPGILAGISHVVVSAWLHDAAIAARLASLGYAGNILSLRADDLAGTAGHPPSLFA